MSATADDPSFAQKIRALIEEHASETRERRIAFHTDFDPDLVFLASGSRGGGHGALGKPTEGEEREKALRALIRFVLATVPDGCEVYCSITRPAAPAAPLALVLVGEGVGACEAVHEGVLTLRWQVAGDRRGGANPDVVALRPRLGDAQAQIVGKSAQALRSGFRAAGWPLSLEAVQGGEEVWVRSKVS